MKSILLLAFTGSVFFCQAQKKTDPSVYGKTIQAENLRKELMIVAGPAFEGRETATAGQRLAAAYIEKKFSDLALAPGNGREYQLPYPVFQDSLVTCTLKVGSDSFSFRSDYDFFIANNYSATLGASEVVYVDYGISDSTRDDYRGLNVQGKVVLIRDGYPQGYVQEQTGRRRFNGFGKLDAAQRHGAIAVLSVQKDFPHGNASAKGNMYQNAYKATIRPLAFQVSQKVAQAVTGSSYDSLVNGTLKPRSFSSDVWIQVNKEIRFLQSTDVLGYLEGTDLKDQLLIISAHYDHLGKRDSVIYFGADDDGSGTVSLLEIAAAFSKAKAAGHGPRRSVLFIANSGEEKGLWGSEYYSEHPTYPTDKTTADLNIDMIGRRDPARTVGDSNNYVYIVGDDKLSSELHPISVGINKKYTRLELDYKFNDPKDPLRIYYRSDHFNFAKKGIPIIFYFDGIHKDYHQPSDTPDKINYDLMEKRARLVFYTAWEMANRPQMLARDLPPVTSER